MLKNPLLCLSVTAWIVCACGGQMKMEDRHSLEYLNSKQGKPLVYPAGVDRPELSGDFIIPTLTPEQYAQEYDVHKLVEPPRLVPLPDLDKDKKDKKKDKKKDTQTAQSEGEIKN